MIGGAIGLIGHKIWWYSEDKHREVAEGETMGLPRFKMLSLLREAGFEVVDASRFVYGLNSLYIGRKSDRLGRGPRNQIPG
jgi:hypothetical protein